MKKTLNSFKILFLVFFITGLISTSLEAIPANWSASNPPAEPQLYRQDFPISIKNADGTVYRSFSIEIPTGWNIVKDGLGFMVVPPVDTRNRMVPKIELQCLPADTHRKTVNGEEKLGEGQQTDSFDFEGFKVVRRYFSPYRGNPAVKGMSIFMLKNNFTLTISTLAENENDMAPMVPLLDWAARSVKIDTKEAGKIPPDGQPAAAGTPASPAKPGNQQVKPTQSSSTQTSHTQAGNSPAPQPAVSKLNPDIVANHESFQGDGSPDTKIFVRLPLAQAQIKSMVLKNTNGVFSVWDTIPGNGMWLLGVNMQQADGSYVNLNNSDGSLKPAIANGDVLFELRVHDVGAISGKGTDYVLEVSLVNGQMITRNISAGDLGKMPAPASTNAGAAASTGAFKIGSTSFIRPAQSVDTVGPYEAIQPDGSPDGRLSVELFALGKNLVHVEIKNTDGVFSLWDSHQNNQMWGLAVLVQEWNKSGYTLLNNPDSSLRPFPVNNSPLTFELRMADGGSLYDGSTNFMVNFVFSDGTNLTKEIGRPQF
ncbi:MAG: hypothetical protein ACOYXC_03200 [Candidatus Rifleibacteriota bacterium]